MTAGGDHVVEAMISAEDRGFWSEPGVSVSGTARAVWSTVTGQQVQGGSTITQQMVRNYYEGVSRDQSVARKIQEIIISIKVDQNESKEWVMEQYLNTIYFGRQAYGIQAAAESYYHKDVDELTPEEAAFLAAAIQQPHPFGEADVLDSTEPLERRWQYVIDGMVTTGAISEDEAAEMEFPVPEAERPADGTDVSGYKGYMLQEAMNELERLGFTEDMVQRHGYEIVTTFDEDMMEAAHDAVEETVPHDTVPEGVNLGMTTIDPETGEVVAFYGGDDYLENQYDTSFHGAAQTGSAFKPYVLATALEEGYSLDSRVDGRGPRDVQGSRVQNAGNDPGGVMSLTQATEESNNLGFVELASEVGFENIRDTAYASGFPEGSIDDNQLVPVMPLGAVSARPVDQASGFGTFANEGVHVEPHVIREINNPDGENERPEVESDRALEESTAADVTHALEQAVNSGTGTAARLDGHPAAGKTGTTDGSVAAWFVGYTPQLSTSVGVYSGDNESFSIPGHNISGGGLPATLWNNYMSRAMEDYEPGEFPPPANEGTTENWAPDTATQQPEEQPEEEPQEPQEPPEEEPPPEDEPPEEEPPPEFPPPEEDDPEVPEPPDEPGIPEDPDEGDQMARSED
ncbi:transglycosylase domain-containing protein [Nocardiopsis salina]|uniref:transglycosylase domain-containing protein n=1 Tax=Nocardiopsis salina TaxID=245836 RepID=UPI0003474BC9